MTLESRSRMIVPCPIVVEPRAIVFPSRILVAARTREARLCCRAEGLIGVLGLECSCPISQGNGCTKSVGQQGSCANPIRSCKKFVNAETGEQIRCHRRPRFFLYWIQPIVDKIGHHPLDGFAGSTTERVISKAGGKAGGGEADQLISRIPSIGRGISGFGHCSQVPVQIVGLSVGTKCKLLIVGIVARGRQSRRQPASGKRAAGLDAIACQIVRVGEVTDDCRAGLVGETRELTRRIVGGGHAVGVGQGQW